VVTKVKDQRSTHQVLVGHPRDLVLEERFELRLLGQLEALGQELLLLLALLLHPLEVPAHLLALLLVGAPLLLQLALQDPRGEERGGRRGS